MKTREIAVTAIFTALVTATTMMIQVYIPETRGYFNLGELMVYLTALLFGPHVGAIAGGVGSALADLLTGYQIYTPATFVIKGVEGFIVGYLSNLFKRKERYAKLGAIFSAILVFTLASIIGVFFYTGTLEWTLGWPLFQYTAAVKLESYIWIIIGALVSLIILYLGYRGKLTGFNVFSMITGGLEMVLGYFLYETVLYGAPAAAVEVPFNIGQVIVGTIGAIILYEPIKNLLQKITSE